MNPRVTQADIAKKLGVHPTTVSLALRNHPSLPEETRKRICSLAESLGYRPDPDLRSLMWYRRSKAEKRNYTATLAYLTNWDTRFGWKPWPAHAQFYEGASKRAAQLGYQLEHFWLGEPGLTDQRLSEILEARGITGVIIASFQPDFNRPLQLDWNRFSAVKIDFSPRENSLHCITNDHASIIRLALRQARAAGYNRVGFVLPEKFDAFADLAWSAGYLSEQLTLPSSQQVPLLRYQTPPFSESQPYKGDQVPAETLKAWLQENRPDMVISWGPFVLPTFQDLGISVPEDMAYADIFLEDMTGGTAGVRQNCLQVGECATDIVADLVEHHKLGVEAIAKTTTFGGTWFEGASMPNLRASTLNPA